MASPAASPCTSSPLDCSDDELEIQLDEVGTSPGGDGEKLLPTSPSTPISPIAATAPPLTLAQRLRALFTLSHTAIVIAMALLANAICYADRTNLSVAIIVIAEEHHWSDYDKGIVLGAFFYGYPCTGMLGGWAADRWGGDTVLRWAVLGWSALTLVTPLAAQSGLASLVLCRVVMGLAEGFAGPCIHSWIGSQVPPSKRTFALTAATSGQHVGTCASMLCAPLVGYYWPSVFYMFGAAGVVWAVAAWACLTPRGGSSGYTQQTSANEDSTGDRTSNDDDDVSIIGSPTSTRSQASPPLRRILTSAAMFGVVVTHVCHNYGFYVLVSWLPQYFTSLGIDMNKLGLLSVMPFLAMFIVDNAWGSTAEKLINSGRLTRLSVRRLSQTIGFIPPAISLALVTFGGLRSPPLLAMTILSIGLGLNSASHAGYWSMLIDLSATHAGLLCGVSNSIAALPGVVGNTVTGAVLQATDGSWTTVFAIVEAVYVVGLVLFFAFARDTIHKAPTSPLPDDVELTTHRSSNQ